MLYSVHYIFIKHRFFGGNNMTQEDKVGGGYSLKPIIVLLGSNPFDLLENDAYAEPGYKIEFDPLGTNIAKTNTNLKIRIPGQYYVKYDYTGKNGKKADTVTRIINVIDRKSISDIPDDICDSVVKWWQSKHKRKKIREEEK